MQSGHGGNYALDKNFGLAMKNVGADGNLRADVSASALGTITYKYKDEAKWSIIWRCEASFRLKT